MFRRFVPSILGIAVLVAAALPNGGPASADEPPVATAPEPAPVEGAAAPGWTRIGLVTTNFAQPGVVRASRDKRLHAVWVRTNSTADDHDLMHVRFEPNGTVSEPARPIQSGWDFMWSVPDVIEVAGEGHLVALVSGIRTTEVGEPNVGINAIRAPQDVSSWVLQIGHVSHGTSGGQVSAVDRIGIPFFAWDASGSILVHRGLDPSTPDFDYQAALGGCCGYNPALVVSRTGRIWVTWYSNAGDGGVWLREVNPDTGAPVGAAMRMPGSSVLFEGEHHSVQQITRTPIAGQGGEGVGVFDPPTGNKVFVVYTGGYPSANRLRVWTVRDNGPEVDAPVIARVGGTKSIRAPAVASDRAGRVWALWTQTVGSAVEIHARRSNPQGTTWGAVVRVGAPKPGATCQSITELTPDATGPAGVDVFATVIEGCGPQHALWHIRMKPGLTLSAQPSAFTGRERITFRVTDAGVPVDDAKVRIAGKEATTDDTGTAHLVLGPYESDKRLTASATQAGFVAAQTIVRSNAR